MLRISRSENNPLTTVLKLEGQVRGQWVDELRQACAAARLPGRGLALDFADVSFIDAAGLDLFRDLAASGVAFHNCSLFAAEQLKAVAHER